MNILDPNSQELNGSPSAGPDWIGPDGYPTPSLHILVADDDAGVRDVLSRVLRNASHRVTCVDDGEAAWGALCTEGFDGMITDNNMPRLSGLDLVRRLRAVPSSLPVIFISGQMPCDEMTLAGLLRPGTALAKPFSFTEMLTVVRRLFAQTGWAQPLHHKRDIAQNRALSFATTPACMRASR